MRDIGEHFSVNRMLAAECYKSRMENGLSFLEFNYMIMQAYDFYVLNNKYNCTMQLGGDDQWSNMIAGVELLRRKDRKSAYAMTCTLLTNSEGQKMGKTAKGALWLDPEKTTPYEFYQYWRNVGDQDVEKCLALLTFLPMDEVRRLGALKDAEINEAKKVLAYEVTKIVHGEDEARKAKEATEALFGSGNNLDNAPKIELTEEDFSKELLDVLVDRKILKTKSEGRRLIEQNGMSLNDEKYLIKFRMRNMRENDIDVVYENLHSNFVKKYFRGKKKQQEIYENHNEWYRAHISSLDYAIYIFEDDENNFVAMTSYEIFDNEARIKIYLNENFRNKKYSQKILAESLNKFLSENLKIKWIKAYILEENIASQKIFSSLNFKYKDEKEICSDGLEYQIYKLDLR